MLGSSCMKWEIICYYVDEFDHDKIKGREMCQYREKVDAQKDLERYQLLTTYGFCRIRAINKG